MAIAGFVMVASSSARLFVRRSLPCFEVLKLNLITASSLTTSLLMANVLMVNVLIERGRDPKLQAGVPSSPIKSRKRRQERVKV